MHIEITPEQAEADKRAENNALDAKHGETQGNANRSMDYWHSRGQHQAMRETMCPKCAAERAAQTIAEAQTDFGSPFNIYVEEDRVTTEFPNLAEAAAYCLTLWNSDAYTNARLVLWHDSRDTRYNVNPRTLKVSK